MAQEIELKLELAPEAAACLEASTLLDGAMTRVDQHALYFDTPRGDLVRAGLSLRIRRVGQKRIQTVKAGHGPSTGLYDRAEWERPVADDTPILDASTPVAALLGKRAATLAPVFAVEVERRSWTLVEGDARIELVLDRGAAIAGERRAPICEVELELQGGRADALFALARKLDAIAPLRLGVLSKGQRGHHLLGPVAVSFRAEPVPMDSAPSVAEAFRLIAGHCVRHYRLNEAILLDRREGQALHQARVAIRRLRSALSLFHDSLADDRFDYFAHAFRELAATLGHARDVDVLLADAQAGDLRDRLETARDAAYARVEAVLAADATRALFLDFVEWLGSDAAPDSGPVVDFAKDALRRSRMRLRKRGDGLRHLSDDARHEARKAAKRLRYAAEFFAALFPDERQVRRHGKFVRALERLQERLGLLNDMATAQDVLKRLDLADDPAVALLVKGAKKSRLLAGAADAYDDLMDARTFWA